MSLQILKKTFIRSIVHPSVFWFILIIIISLYALLRVLFFPTSNFIILKLENGIYQSEFSTPKSPKQYIKFSEAAILPNIKYKQFNLVDLNTLDTLILARESSLSNSSKHPPVWFYLNKINKPNKLRLTIIPKNNTESPNFYISFWEFRFSSDGFE